mmetsp:Transcript_78361/g.234879  ORF Transcript_78361/g.234879 Transcript_78361/m.234879 type:complete len:315 (-) Transcript_78361:260-1204(-)
MVRGSTSGSCCCSRMRRALSGEAGAGRAVAEARSGGAPYTVFDVVDWMHEERASAISVLDVEHVMGGAVGNHLVFANANTKAHMRRIAKAVVYELKERGVVVFGSTPKVEGIESQDWMLVDGGDVVVNVFTEFTRQQYDLDAHWTSLGGRPVELQHLEQRTEAAAPAVDPLIAWSEAAAAGAAAGALSSAGRRTADEDAIYDETGEELLYAETASAHGLAQRPGAGDSAEDGSGAGDGRGEGDADGADGDEGEYMYEYEYYDEGDEANTNEGEYEYYEYEAYDQYEDGEFEEYNEDDDDAPPRDGATRPPPAKK